MIQDRAWYLIHTKPRQEDVAFTNLERQQYQVYLPYLTRHRRVKGQLIAKHEPLFSRYLFIRLSRVEDDWAPIRSTRGVVGLVRFGGTAAKVPANLISLIKQREQEQKNQIEMPQYVQGERVRIVEGIMQGYEGIVSDKNNKNRVTLLLKLVGETARVDVSTESLIKLLN